MKHLPCAEILHASDPKLFRRYRFTVGCYFRFRHGMASSRIESRFLPRRPWRSDQVSGYFNKVFRSDTLIESDIPNVYSELMALEFVTGVGSCNMNVTREPRKRPTLKSWLANHVPGVRGTALSVASLILRHAPVERCPAFWSDLLEVKVARAIRPYPAKSTRGSLNINIIFDLLRRTAEVPGDIAECGVFRGSSLLAIGGFVK